MNKCTPDPKKGMNPKKKKVDYSGFAHKKVQPMRSLSYKKFIRSLPCIICGMPSEHSHEPLEFISHGTGIKGPDNESLPLCGSHHRTSPQSRHNLGQHLFYKLHSIDWRKTVVEYQSRFKKGIVHSKTF